MSLITEAGANAIVDGLDDRIAASRDRSNKARADVIDAVTTNNSDLTSVIADFRTQFQGYIDDLRDETDTKVETTRSDIQSQIDEQVSKGDDTVAELQALFDQQKARIPLAHRPPSYSTGNWRTFYDALIEASEPGSIADLGGGSPYAFVESVKA